MNLYWVVRFWLITFSACVTTRLRKKMYARFEGINFVLLMEARGVTRSRMSIYSGKSTLRIVAEDWTGMVHDMIWMASIF
jgi:hypothetical protein